MNHIVVNESLARCGFLSRDGGTVIGMAADARNAGLDRPADPEFYLVRKRAWDGMPGSGRSCLASPR